jgi:hypothetical protein
VEHRTLDDPQLTACWGASLSRLTLRLHGLAPGDPMSAELRVHRAAGG